MTNELEEWFKRLFDILIEDETGHIYFRLFDNQLEKVTKWEILPDYMALHHIALLFKNK